MKYFVVYLTSYFPNKTSAPVHSKIDGGDMFLQKKMESDDQKIFVPYQTFPVYYNAWSPYMRLPVTVVISFGIALNFIVICKVFVPRVVDGWHCITTAYVTVPFLPCEVDMPYSYSLHYSFIIWSHLHKPIAYVLWSYVVLQWKGPIRQQQPYRSLSKLCMHIFRAFSFAILVYTSSLWSYACL